MRVEQAERVGETKSISYVFVHVQTDAKRESVSRVGDVFTVAVKEPAEHNFANKRVREIIASELDVPTARARLVKGHRSQRKMFQITR